MPGVIRTVFMSTLVSAVLAAPTFAESPSTVDSTSTSTVVVASNKLAFRLLEKLASEDSSHNVLLSPVSIELCSGLAYEGAVDGTRSKMAGFLGLDSLSSHDAKKSLADFQSAMENSSNLTVANAVWVSKRWHLSNGYVSSCLHDLHAGAISLDFSDPASAAQTINSWVDKNTHGKIPSIVAPDDLTNSDAILTDTAYFHAGWASPFNKSETAPGLFRDSSGNSVDIPMMNSEQIQAYYEDDQVQAVWLPFMPSHAGDVQMVIVLPKGEADAQFLQTLETGEWAAIESGASTKEVTLSMPKVSASSGGEMLPELEDLGFPAPGDYSDTGIPLFEITEVFHRCTLDVDEKGVIASAATAIAGVAGGMAPQLDKVTMTVDHPFFFAMEDTKSKVILFDGLIREPVPTAGK